MTALPLVSVVIPTLNEERYLPALLRCLQAQRDSSIQIIIADHHSTDHTREIGAVSGACLTDGGLPGRGRNAGSRLASGKYLLFLDADIQFDPDFLWSLLDAMERRRLGAASCWFRADTRSPILRAIHLFANLYFSLMCRFGFPYGIGACLMIRRELHEAVGGFDESIAVAEDQDYIRRVARIDRYEYLREPTVQISARRFVREGWIKLCAKWIWIDIHRWFLGEIRGEGVVKYF